MQGTEHFDLAATIDAVTGAVVSIVCRVGFDAAVHGIIVGLIIAAIGIVLMNRKHRYGKPLLAVFKKILIFCSILGLPGVIALVSTGKLPPVNNLVLSSVGLIGFWALVTLHLCMEEMNFQYFQQDTPQET
jgi:hypothetical protein